MARVERRSLSRGSSAELPEEQVPVMSRGASSSGSAQATLDEIEALMMQGLTVGRQAVAVGETVKGVAVSLRDQLQETVRILRGVGR